MNLNTIPILEDIQGPWSQTTIKIAGNAEPHLIHDVYPFISVTDLKRLIWIQYAKGDPRFSPEHIFIGVRNPAGDGIRPLEFHWSSAVSQGSVYLPDPLSFRAPNPELVDSAGNRKPIGPTMTGGLTLEAALAPELTASNGKIPIIEVIPLMALITNPTLAPEQLTSSLYGGYYQLYFPWLTSPGQVLDSANTASGEGASAGEGYVAIIPYIQDRTQRIELVNQALRAKQAGKSVSMHTVVRIRWTLPLPSSKPESLERTFYSLPVSSTIPFLRYFPPGKRTAPLLKIGLESNGSPIPPLDDHKIFTKYLNIPAPSTTQAVVLALIPMESSRIEKGSAFILYMFEDGTSDITLEVPQRGAKYIAAVASDAQNRLMEVMEMLGFPSESKPILRDIHATYKWQHPDPRRSAPLTTSKILKRVAVFSPFLDATPMLPDERATAVFRWRAVSNYESESAQAQYLTQLILRKEAKGKKEDESLHYLVTELQKKFGLTAAHAQETILRWMERRTEVVAPAIGKSAGSFAVSKHSNGASIAIYSSHPEYMIEVQDVQSFDELQRIMSVMGVLLSSREEITQLRQPSSIVAAEAKIAVADQAIAAAAVAQGPPPEEDIAGADTMEGTTAEEDAAMAEMLAQMGIGGDEDEDMGPPEAVAEAIPESGMIMEEEAEVEAGAGAGAGAGPPKLVVEELDIPLPDIDKLAVEEEECHGNPWSSSDVPIPGRPDWYMAKLKEADTTLFEYVPSKTGRARSYSKSCQRRDDRQPTVLNAEEYARIRRCYKDKVKFVDLPPHKPEDLPQDPTFNPKQKYPDDYFTHDPQTKRPMWIFYNYIRKTRDPVSPLNPNPKPVYLFLTCSELWCERDHLPILPAEFESTEGRGFTKAKHTCPFCGGSVIKDMKSPAYGQSVIVRKAKASTGKVHSFIGTITRNKHPLGYLLPCCDTTPRFLKKYMIEAASGKLVYGKEILIKDDGDASEAPEEDIEDIPEPEPGMEEMGAVGPGQDYKYEQKLSSMQTQYIIGNDKALDGGKIGLLPPQIDALFGQNGPRSLIKEGIRPTFAKDAILFVRVGVDNQIHNQGHNLFAGLAPLLGKNNAEQTLRLFMGQPNPLRPADAGNIHKMVRAFEGANYGSLVIEFAAKAPMRTIPQIELENFATRHDYILNEASRPHLIRLYRAWTYYLEYLNDIKTPKQLRHIEHILSYPGPILPTGLMLFVIEQDKDKIQVRCPTFGIPLSPIFTSIPIAFILHDLRDESWEPIVLYNGTKDALRIFNDIYPPSLVKMPTDLYQNLQRWMKQWRNDCKRPSPPPHVWTPDKDTSMLPRFSQLFTDKYEGYTRVGIVRDRSNRLAGILFKMTAGDYTLFVPCLDDGTIAFTLVRYFEAEMIPPAPLSAYLSFYTTMIGTKYKGLLPTHLLTRIQQNTIIGFRTAVGTMIQVIPEPIGDSPLPIQQLDRFVWEFDNIILRPADAPPQTSSIVEESSASIEEQMSEAYQHLRLSFSRWLNRDARGPKVKNFLKNILTSRHLLYKKRKMIDIELEGYITEMLMTEKTEERKSLSLLREDCIALKNQGSCSSVEACRWRTPETSSETGRCMIHVPYREIDPVAIFTARLTDEILRYTAKRRELLLQKVPIIRNPKGVVRIRDELYIETRFKESAEDILTRLGFMNVAPTAFPEELLKMTGLEDEPNIDETVLPSTWLQARLTIPTIPIGMEESRRIALAAALNKPFPTIEADIAAKLGELGYPPQPFQWSDMDMHILGAIYESNVVFVRQGKDGKIFIEKWYEYSLPTPDKKYIVFWGPNQLVVMREKKYILQRSQLPSDLRIILDESAPDPVVIPARQPQPQPQPQPAILAPFTAIAATLSSLAAPAPPVAAPSSSEDEDENKDEDEVEVEVEDTEAEAKEDDENEVEDESE